MDASPLKDAEIEGFIEGFKQPTWRGMRVGGQRVPSGQASTAGAVDNRQSGFNGSVQLRGPT
jgi:hypothetical protein